MEKIKTIPNNQDDILITEFLSENDILPSDEYELYLYNKQKTGEQFYTDSFDSIQPLVKKIVEVDMSDFEKNDELKMAYSLVKNNWIDFNIEKIYEHAVQFIRLYNIQKK